MFLCCVFSYLAKETLRTSSHEKFNGLIVFLCQIYVTMRTISGEHFKVLVDPIFQCLEMLINSDTSDELDILNSLVRTVFFFSYIFISMCKFCLNLVFQI